MTGRHGKPAPVTRRSALAGIAALGAAATGPWVVRSEVLAAAGRVNVLMWSTALPPGFLKSFTARTGIEVNYVGIDSNEEIIAGMKAVGGRGVDIIGPTSMRAPQWAALDLLQPFDLGRIGNIDNVNPAMREIGDKEWNFGGKGSHWLPHLWGTEGVAWRTDLWTPPRAGAMPSYGDLWGEDVISEAISGHIISKNFLGEHAPTPTKSSMLTQIRRSCNPPSKNPGYGPDNS